MTITIGHRLLFTTFYFRLLILYLIALRDGEGIVHHLVEADVVEVHIDRIYMIAVADIDDTGGRYPFAIHRLIAAVFGNGLRAFGVAGAHLAAAQCAVGFIVGNALYITTVFHLHRPGTAKTGGISHIAIAQWLAYQHILQRAKVHFCGQYLCGMAQWHTCGHVVHGLGHKEAVAGHQHTGKGNTTQCCYVHPYHAVFS